MTSGKPEVKPLAKTYVEMYVQSAHRSFDVLKLREIVDTLAESHLALLREKNGPAVKAAKPVAPAPVQPVARIAPVDLPKRRVVTQK